MEIQIPEGSFEYEELSGAAIELTRYQGLSGHVEIPERLPGKQEHLPVGAIGKKAFLSKKYLRSVTVPKTVESVGDWAFAFCDSLREVAFLGKDVTFGKDVFKECRNLTCIRFVEDGDPRKNPCHGNFGESCNGMGELTAAAVTQMESAYLLDAKEIGTAEWLEKWDARMLAILRAPDDEGYAKQILCGEEDYESADLDTYLSNSRKKKVRLLLLRLLWPKGLSEETERECRAYLLSHTKGCKTQEAWEVVRDGFGNRREFYELFARLGLFTKENATAVIAETREDCPEMRAFFLRYQAEHFQAEKSDFFDELEL
ncbi:MAG: leucine-rich repeat domain-containing protein [Acetatifactor sp.]|nr:leucine-rich repeat domain-containing protein [Acetatifactor sp.]